MKAFLDRKKNREFVNSRNILKAILKGAPLDEKKSCPDPREI